MYVKKNPKTPPKKQKVKLGEGIFNGREKGVKNKIRF
jgi:hypothetical protein